MIQAVLNHLWQSSVFAAAAALLTLALRNNAANTRFCLWLAASLKFLVPFSLLIVAGSQLGRETAPMAVASDWVAMVGSVIEPASPVAVAAVPSDKPLFDLASVLAVVWACGFAAVIFRWLAAWLRVKRIVAKAQPVALGLPVAALSSATLREPGVFGIFRPVLLLPEGLDAQLGPQQFEAIVAHELCHVRRRDNLTAAIHMIVEAVFWFHPLVWWLGARMIDERERACDEAVVRAGRNPQIYAESILKICRLYAAQSLPCAAGVSGGDLKRRIEGIMAGQVIGLRLSKKFLLAAAAAAALAAPVLVGIARAPSALADDTPTLSDAQSAALTAQRYAEQARVFKAVAIDPKLLDDYVGYYQHGSLIFSITRDGDRLFSHIVGQPVLEYLPYDDHEFFQPDLHLQLSFAGDGHGKANTLVAHQNGGETQFARLDDVAAESSIAQLAHRVKSKTPQPGSEAALRRYLDEADGDQPRFEQLSPDLAAIARNHLSTYRQLRAPAGAFRSIAFKRVLPDGRDIYEVRYENAVWDWQISLAPDAKVTALWGEPES